MSINDLLAKAKLPTPSGIASSVRDQVKTSIRSTSQEIKNIPAQFGQALKSDIGSATSGAINTGVTAVRSSIAQALTGDFSGALSTLAQGPQNIMGTFTSAFGLGDGVSSGGATNANVNTLQGVLARADPMLSFQWFCELPTITPIGGQPMALDWSYVEEATPAFRNYDVRQVYRQGRFYKVPSSYSVDNLRLNFYADIANQSAAYLRAWDGAILAPFTSSQATRGGGFGRPAGYQKTIRIVMVDSAKALVLLLEYTECWPTNIDSLHLDSGSSTRLTYNVNFSAGDVFITAFGVNSNISGKSLLDAIKGPVVASARNLVGNGFNTLLASL